MPKSSRKRSTVRGNRRGRGTATAAVETITRPSQSLPVVIFLSLWRWRWELALTTVTVVVFYHLTAPGGLHLEPVAALLVMVAPFPVLLAIGPVRRFLRARMWCVITRHRVRACLTEMRTLNWSGNLPFIIGCLSTKTGEVVWLWMRPGLSAEDLENKAETLASACWARQALIGRTNRNAALIRIDIDRRDPLANKHITSPLLDDTHGLPEAQVPDDAVLAFLGPDNTTTSDGSTTEQPATQTGARAGGETNPKTKRTKTSAAVPDGESVVLVNGEDVSDYV
jgi:hypothetical protein